MECYDFAIIRYACHNQICWCGCYYRDVLDFMDGLNAQLCIYGFLHHFLLRLLSDGFGLLLPVFGLVLPAIQFLFRPNRPQRYTVRILLWLCISLSHNFIRFCLLPTKLNLRRSWIGNIQSKFDYVVLLWTLLNWHEKVCLECFVNYFSYSKQLLPSITYSIIFLLYDMVQRKALKQSRSSRSTTLWCVTETNFVDWNLIKWGGRRLTLYHRVCLACRGMGTWSTSTHPVRQTALSQIKVFSPI